MIVSSGNILQRDRLLAIGSTPALADYLRRRYPDCQIERARSMLEGIDDLSRHEVRAVIALVDPDDPRLDAAVAGLREAAGDRPKVLLCSGTEGEPRLRAVLESGADDYLLWPLEGGELDTALGFVPAGSPDLRADGPPSAALEELAMLGGVLGSLAGDRFALLSKLADLIRLALGAEGATLVVDGSVASSGAAVIDAVLTEPIVSDERPVGRITVGRRATAYTAGDVTKLQHYARLAAQILTTAHAQRLWRHQAMTDATSGLFNRRYVLQFLDDLLVRARAERFRVTVLLFDIDDFKTYNDRYGHPAGDEIIRATGELFAAHCREHDVVARFGGDEFCVVFWDAGQPRVAGSRHPADALTVLTRFREALKSYQCKSLGAESKGQLTISGGLASFPWDAATSRELIDRADQALLRAKRAGKNQVFAFCDDSTNDNTAPTDF